jgi:L-histidine Nalpha-methyltransferase
MKTATTTVSVKNEFFQDVWTGLRGTPKSLSSKYFYNEAGDKIFQEIMDCDEYYLTRCELEIFTQQSDSLIAPLLHGLKDFDVVELGAGDCYKSIHLLRSLVKHNASFTYYPIDISSNVITQLKKRLPSILPGLQMTGLNGDYFDMLEEAKLLSDKNKVVLFLGSSIGNIPFEETVSFLRAMRSHLRKGDLVLIGFDLKKDPQTILNAYNDKEGITRRFNLNLLQRINDELDADFRLDQFEHCPTYDEKTGACKSYLKSLKKQRVRIGEEGWIRFEKDELIYMEVSQKYTVEQTDAMAMAAGFSPVNHFYDSKNWFVDALWRCE